MKTTRHKVFETNSSSTHSITFNDEDSIMVSTDWELSWNIIGTTIQVTTNEFGWGREDYNDFYTKLSYLATYIIHHSEGIDGPFHEKLTNLIKEYLNSELEIIDGNGHIDHQSVDVASSILSESSEYIANYLFNKSVTLIIDSDG